MDYLNLHNISKASDKLGPFKRFIIYTQGCNKNCKGCIAQNTHSNNINSRFCIDELSQMILDRQDIEGITISGGEPMLQSKSLNKLLLILKSKKDLGVILYSGFLFEEIKDEEILQNIDLLIDGEYKEELDNNQGIIGSTNQNIHFLTNRYREFEGYFREAKREVEINILEDSFSLIGVPGIKAKKILKNIKGIR